MQPIKPGTTEKAKKIQSLAGQVWRISHDALLMRLRFLDSALSALKAEPRAGTGGAACDGSTIYYDPAWLLSQYREDSNAPVRLYLHILLHCVFNHRYGYDMLCAELWNLAADLAVEHTILELDCYEASCETDDAARAKLLLLKEEAGGLTAERLYHYFKINPPSSEQRRELDRLFYRDSHQMWKAREVQEIPKEQWRKIGERVKADIKSFSRQNNNTESLTDNLEEATRERYDYGQILQRFMVMGEEAAVNEEEFDYIYYTYGLRTYGNLPLVEPLEYREARKVKEFVIAIDTSASCRGALVRSFLRKTYSLLKGSENFFRKMKVHILQCDSEVRSDTLITGEEDFERFLREGKLSGFGATDFRPVFEYVDRLLREGAFENLKGLIYFTDGYGIYPERMPAYDCLFVFTGEDGGRHTVPPWAVPVVIDEEELDRNGTRQEEYG